uniref:Transmembrane protein 170B-like n=1 Tax=Sinocyclocheilus anshuiensis TaxID=1608454 RepID=A0A671M3K0_9TELE
MCKYYWPILGLCLCVLSAEMWYWVFLWCLFSSLFVHSTVGLLMCVTLQRHKRGRLITLVLISVGFLASLTGGVITSAAVAGVYRVAGKDMAPLEALVFGVGQNAFTVIISFSRILATL